MGSHYQSRPVGIKNVLANSLMLVTGASVGSGFGLVASLLLARYLGPVEYGALAIIQACAVTVRGFFSTQSWQALVKYGVVIFAGPGKGDFFDTCRIVFVIELASIFASGTVTVLIVLLLGPSIGLPAKYVHAGVIYSMTVFLNFSDYFGGLLRLFNKFKLLLIHMSFFSIARLALVGVIYTLRLPFVHCVYIMAFAEGLKNITLAMLGILVYNSAVGEPFWNLFGRASQGQSQLGFRTIGSFLLPVWIWSTLRMLPREVDILVVGSISGPSSAGLYRIAKQSASILSRVYAPIYQALFPDVNILRERNMYRELRRLVRQSITLVLSASLSLSLVFVAFGRPLLSLIGQQYTSSYSAAVVYILGLSIFSVSIPVTPLLFSLDHGRDLVVIYVISTVAYFVFLVPLALYSGILGAAAGYVVFSFLCATLTLIVTAKVLREREDYKTDEQFAK